MRFNVFLCALMFVHLSGCDASTRQKSARKVQIQSTEVMVLQAPKSLKGLAGLKLARVMVTDRQGNKFEVVVPKSYKLEPNDTFKMVPVYIDQNLYEENYSYIAPD